MQITIPNETHLEKQLLLRAALEGLELQKHRLETQIHEIEDLLRRGGGTFRVGRLSGPEGLAAGKRRTLTESHREKIAEAQRKRWAARKARLTGNAS